MAHPSRPGTLEHGEWQYYADRQRATTVGSISSTSGATTANPTANILTIPSGVTLTDSVHSRSVQTTLRQPCLPPCLRPAAVTVVNGTVNVAQTNSVAVLDLSGLNSVTTTGTVNILNGAGLQGTVNLANTKVGNVAPVNSISTSALNMATTGTNNPNGNSTVLNLGSGVNNIFASTMNLGTAAVPRLSSLRPELLRRHR